MATASDKFARLSALRLARGRPYAEMQTGPPSAPERSPQTEEEFMLARMLGATVERTKFGSHLSVRHWHPTPEFCAPSAGVVELLQAATVRKSVTRRAGPDSGDGINPLLHDPERWLFLDTETTGISGGTGTYAFLIGIAWWDAGGLQVEQLLMRDFSEEHSVLDELARRIAERPVLVTFNGRTFDWPLLENRYLMTRRIPVPKLAAHLDLLHPARAVWKLRLGCVKLMELERHVLDAERLGWNRADDVPSNMIPQIYFDFLRGRSVAPIAGVVRHNRNDLRGLAALFGKLNEFLGNGEYGEDADGLDLFGLSRYLQRRGRTALAESAYAEARERGLPIAMDERARWELAKMAKRQGDHEKAARMWEELSRDDDWKAAACAELALFHERRRKDLPTAVRYGRQAVTAWRKRTSENQHERRTKTEVIRLERWERKIARLQSRSKVMSGSMQASLLGAPR